jgi:hypothetical protein
MPLTILNVPAATVRTAQKAGTVDETFAPLWAEYADQDIECFTCAAAIPAGTRPFSQFVPDKPRGPNWLVVLPLCQRCTDLRPLVRLNRCLKLLRKMWSRPGGPQVHFR